MKKTLLVLLMVLTVLVNVFAGGASEAPAADANEPIHLEWWTWDPELVETNEQIIANFEAENPGVTVTQTMVGTKEYWTKIRIQATQKKLPDVMTMSSGSLEEWAKEGLLYNLDEFVNNDDTFDVFYKSIFDAAKTISGTDHYYCIPFAHVTTVLYYNKDMFDAAGLEYPNEDWTWDDFLSAAKKLTLDKDGDGKTDQWGYWGWGRYSNVEPWIYANNGNLIDRNTMRFAPDENALEAMRFTTDLVTKHKVAPPKKEMSALKYSEVFPNELCAMWIDGSWFVNNLRKTASPKFDWGITKVPSGPHGSNDVVYGWPDSYAIAANTKHPEMAWKFARYVAGEGINLDLYMAGKIPSCKKLAEDPMFADPDQMPGEDMLILLDQASSETKTSYTMGWNEWRGYGGAETLGLSGMYDAIIDGEIGFDEGLAKVTENINKVLARFYK